MYVIEYYVLRAEDTINTEIKNVIVKVKVNATLFYKLILYVTKWVLSLDINFLLWLIIGVGSFDEEAVDTYHVHLRHFQKDQYRNKNQLCHFLS